MLPGVDIQYNLAPKNDEGRPATTAIFSKRKITVTPEKGRVLDSGNEFGREKRRDVSGYLRERSKSRNGNRLVYKTLNDGYKNPQIQPDPYLVHNSK